jgi:hypothetical protein
LMKQSPTLVKKQPAPNFENSQACFTPDTNHRLTP